MMQIPITHPHFKISKVLAEVLLNTKETLQEEATKGKRFKIKVQKVKKAVTNKKFEENLSSHVVVSGVIDLLFENFNIVLQEEDALR